MAVTAAAAVLAFAATCTNTGRFASIVDLREASAVPEKLTLTAGFVQTAFTDAELSQPPLQVAAPSQDGGFSATLQVGAVNSTSQEPVQEPLQVAEPLSCAVHLPWHVPSQEPLQEPLAVVAWPVPELA